VTTGDEATKKSKAAKCPPTKAAKQPKTAKIAITATPVVSGACRAM